MIKIAIVDDHPSVINGIGAWLKSSGRFEIAGTAGTLAGACELMQRLDSLPAVVILDISLGARTPVSPPEDGLEFIPMLKEICAKRNAALPGILVCSTYEDPFLIQRAIDMGARAYVPKSAELNEILSAVDALCSVNTELSVDAEYSANAGCYANAECPANTGLAGGIYINEKYRPQKQNTQDLTRREKEIVSLIRQHMSAKKIAISLNISLRTVENHLAHIYTKTGTNSREELFEL